jgi:hypothetical protein
MPDCVCDDPKQKKKVSEEALAKLPEYAIVQRPPLRGHRLRNRGHRGGSRCGRGRGNGRRGGSGSGGLDGVQERWKITTICIESRRRSRPATHADSDSSDWIS